VIPLLDVNVLVALAWPNHVHHRLARTWFEAQHAAGWATCPVTETGFVRISSNPRVVDEARTPKEAVLLLQRMLQIPGHRFWTDDVSVAQLSSEFARVHGYRQVMDAHLLALARRNDGRLAAFDRRITDLLARDADRDRYVLILE
jgi:toxin-antitoxin system PIN domain toxin